MFNSSRLPLVRERAAAAPMGWAVPSSRCLPAEAEPVEPVVEVASEEAAPEATEETTTTGKKKPAKKKVAKKK